MSGGFNSKDDYKMNFVQAFTRMCFGYDIQTKRRRNERKFFKSLAKQEELLNSNYGFQRHFVSVGKRLKRNANKALKNAK